MSVSGSCPTMMLSFFIVLIIMLSTATSFRNPSPLDPMKVMGMSRETFELKMR